MGALNCFPPPLPMFTSSGVWALLDLCSFSSICRIGCNEIGGGMGTCTLRINVMATCWCKSHWDETMGWKDNCLYFDFAGSDYSSYQEMLKVACQTLSPLQQNLLKFSLSLRSYSAAVQAFQQVSTGNDQVMCRAFYQGSGRRELWKETLESTKQPWTD